MRDTRDPILVRWDYSLVGQSTILKSSRHIRETISHRIPVTLLGETIENIEIGIRRIGGQDTGRWEGTIKCIVSDLVGRNKKSIISLPTTGRSLQSCCEKRGRVMRTTRYCDRTPTTDRQIALVNSKSRKAMATDPDRPEPSPATLDPNDTLSTPMATECVIRRGE